MKKYLRFTIILLFVNIFFISCSSIKLEETEAIINLPNSSPKKIKKQKYNEEKFFNALERGELETCTSLLLGQKITKTNQIKQLLDIALAEHFVGAYNSSIKVFNKTDRLMEDAITKSITRGVISATLNENASLYEGTIYEYIYINMFNALNYYNSGNLEDALVEIRKINNKQKEYIAKYGEVILSTDERTQREITQADYDASMLGINMVALKAKSPPRATDIDIFRDSATARYLSMIFKLMIGELDNARIDKDVLKKLNESFPVENSFSFEKDKGVLNVISFSGLIGRRSEQVFYFPGDVVNGLIGLGFGVIGFGSNAMIVLPPLPNGIVIPAFRLKFAYPTFNKLLEKKSVSKVVLSIDGDGKDNFHELKLLEDFNEAVEKDVRTKGERAFTKSIFRSISKKAIAVTAGSATLSAFSNNINQKGSVFENVFFDLAYLSVAGTIEAVDLAETADIRQSVFLPATSYATSITLSPGIYNVTVFYLDSSSRIISKDNFQNVQIDKGSSVLLESSFIKR